MAKDNQMKRPSLSAPESFLDAIEDRREKGVNRSQHIREGVAVRHLLEDRGEFNALLEEARTEFDYLEDPDNDDDDE